MGGDEKRLLRARPPAAAHLDVSSSDTWPSDAYPFGVGERARRIRTHDCGMPGAYARCVDDVSISLDSLADR
ncbi:hypothetical protein, partial [Methylobacterium frigidaeris]|uniref:hypothetical protein n=1 Tax=Methylobacterium frigidaeris TaxID=2038277 RepID=UPI001A9C44DD